MSLVLRTALVVLAFATAAIAAGEASAQGRIVGRYGDWQIRCDRQVGAPGEECALIQNVEAADRANVALTVIFIRTADGQAQILRVLAPLGVLLPPGLGLTIDGAEVGAAGFVRCIDSGCVAEVQLDSGLIERLQAGKVATFSIFTTPEEGIGIPISLTGFRDGFGALENPPTETLEAVAPTAPVEAETEAVEPAAPYETASFASPEEEDEVRSFLTQLVEDELFPYVAAAVAAVVLLILLLIVLLVRMGRRRRTERREPAVTPRAEPPAATAQAAAAGGGAPRERQTPRLAPDAPQRHLPQKGSGAEPRPRPEGAVAAPRRPERPS